MRSPAIEHALVGVGFSMLVWLPGEAADFPATLDWARRVELGTPVSGVIDEIRVRPGQEVSKGELLLRLDPRGLQARIAAAGAALEEARLRRAEAQREAERTSELYDRTLLSEHEREVADIDRAAAETAYRRAEAALIRARLDLEHSRLRAPFDGLVVLVTGAEGEAVASRLRVRPLVTVADNRRMRAKTRLTSDQARSLRPGQIARVAVGDEWVDARIQALGWEPAQPPPNETLYDLYVIFEVPAGSRLRAGQPVTVRFND